MSFYKWACGITLACAVTGCGPSLPQTVKLGGKVTLDGKPLPQGMVKFYPSEKEGSAPVVAPIIDGLYSAPVVPQGSYRASFDVGEVMASEQPLVVDSTFNAPDPRKQAKKNPIPEKYRKPSLPADASADNMSLNFDLISK